MLRSRVIESIENISFPMSSMRHDYPLRCHQGIVAWVSCVWAAHGDAMREGIDEAKEPLVASKLDEPPPSVSSGGFGPLPSP